ncbi:MAG: rhomboid family intramembrane serine protease [bacterium]|nr:rhomboid family intramembrane serine protease [bacterium]
MEDLVRLTYNAPVVLTFVLAAAAIMVADVALGGTLTATLFSSPPVLSLSPLTIVRYGAHALGHAGWDHLIGNAMLLLLLGPIVEEKYGSGRLLLMIVITAFATGIGNALFFSAGVLGASGIVFMLIALASLTNIRAGEIPLTFVAVVLAYGGQEILHALRDDQISQFAHLFGGTCGATFGFLTAPTTRTPTPPRVE